MPSIFPTTRRSVVQALGSEDAGERTRAFDTLVAIYWKPLYKLARLSLHRSPEDAEDLTQAFARLRESVSDEQFAIFDAYDLSDDSSISYRDLGAQFGLPETTVTNHLSAVRQKFRQAVLETLRDATASDDEFRAEARALL